MMNVTGLMRDTQVTIVSCLTPKETRALSTTCRYFREFMQTGETQQTLLATHYPLYRPLCDGRGVSVLSARSAYARKTAAYSKALGLVRSRTITIERSNGYNLLLTPDGKKIIVQLVNLDTGVDEIGLYELDTGRCIRRFPPASVVTALQISSNTLFVGRSTREGIYSVDCIDPETGGVLQTIEGDFHSFPTCIQSFDKKYVYMGQTSSSVVQRFHIETGQCVNTYNGPRIEGINHSVQTLFQNGTRAISALENGNLVLWRVEDGEILKTLNGHAASSITNPPRFLQVSLDGTKAVSLWENSIRVWDLTTNECLSTIDISALKLPAIELTYIQVTPDLKRACIGFGEKQITLIDLEKGQHLITKQSNFAIRGLQITPDGTGIIARTSYRGSSQFSIYHFQLPEELLHQVARDFSNGLLDAFRTLPKFARRAISETPSLLTAVATYSDATHIYNATQVSLPTIRGFLEQALREPESAALLAREAMDRLKNLPPVIRNTVRWDLLKSSSEETPSKQQIRDGIAAIDQAIAEFSIGQPARRPIPEGKQE